MKFQDLTGYTFGMCKVIKRLPNKGKDPYWECMCSCGKITSKTSSNLKKKTAISCGCYRTKLSAQRLSKIQQSKRLPIEVSAVKSIWSRYRVGYNKNPLSKEIPFSLTVEDFLSLIYAKCHYCGVLPFNTFSHQDTGESIKYNGIDRVVPSKGYVLNNVVSCCKICNQAKTDMSLEEFLSWLDRICMYRMRDEV